MCPQQFDHQMYGRNVLPVIYNNGYHHQMQISDFDKKRLNALSEYYLHQQRVFPYRDIQMESHYKRYFLFKKNYSRSSSIILIAKYFRNFNEITPQFAYPLNSVK